MLKSLRDVRRFLLDRVIRIRLTGFGPNSESVAKNAHRTGFHRSRNLTPAGRADARLTFSFNGSKRFVEWRAFPWFHALTPFGSDMQPIVVKCSTKRTTLSWLKRRRCWRSV